MFKWIRWSGLIGVVVFFGLIAAFILFAAGPLIKLTIESAGSAAAGAKVEVADVSVTLAPIGVELQGLTVANADKPMENLMQFDRATAELELGPLYLGKSIIRELSVTGMKFNTSRSTSGALEKKQVTSTSDGDEKKESSESQLSSLAAKLPSLDEIMERETLQTKVAGDAFVETYKTRKQQLDEALKKVPTSKDLAQYEDEVRALTSGELKSLDDFLQRKKKLEALRDRFKADKKAVNQAKDLIGETRIDVTHKLTELKNAPSRDLANLSEKYQLNETGAANLTGLLFGAEAAGWATQTLEWYEKISPYLNSGEEEPEEVRLEGRFVHFPTSDPWPEFLIRYARFDAQTDAGDLLIEAKDLTNQQRVLGRPAIVKFDGAGLRKVETLNAVLTLDHTTADSKDTLTLDMTNWQMDSVNLGLGDTQMETAQVQLQAMAQVADGKTLVSRLDSQFGNTEFSGKGNTQFAKELTTALQTISEFTVEARANGKLKSPTVDMKSDLDKRLNQAFNQRLRQKQDQLEARLQKRLNGLVDDYAGEYADELKALNNNDQKLTDKLASLEDLLKAKLDEYKDQKKKELQNKLNNKADDLKDSLKDDAKNALKKLF
ncbi:MAG: TIGR03545 family protein [Oceanobacter sp.]